MWVHADNHRSHILHAFDHSTLCMRLISPAAAGMLTAELLVDRLRAALWGVYIGA